MPANTSPIFVLSPNLGTATITGSSPARDGSGTLFNAFTAASSGSRIDYMVFTSASPSTGSAYAAKVCRIFVTDTSGLSPRLRGELAMSAVTPSATAIGSTNTFTFTNGMVLQPGQIVKVNQTVWSSAIDNTDVFVHGGDY